MGWVSLLLLMVATLALVRILGTRGGLITGCAAALLIGAAGYALQGSPDRAAAPARIGEGHEVVPLTEARHLFYGYFSSSESWLRISEALERDGKSEDSVGILENAVMRYPGDPQLWVGLGNALVDHARGLTPPAELAYSRAEQVAPGHAGARFFYGLALARSGDRKGALDIWQQLLKNAPPRAPWRAFVERGVEALGGRPPTMSKQS